MAEPGAGEIWFYHLERSRADEVLPELLERTLARGWRALVRHGDAKELAKLDARLWAYRDDSFLAHGLESERFAEDQPILLSSGEAASNGAQALFVLDASDGPVDGYERCVVLFEAADEGAMQRARELWRRYKAQGRAVTYWRQAERGWTKVA
ncbi:MAG TPA: DNA polymerase III subunit chi [Caulobacteraceae bacterium]|nr:DNA polymerase III subunit chi [Caulobacteraceae bacterium]